MNFTRTLPTLTAERARNRPRRLGMGAVKRTQTSTGTKAFGSSLKGNIHGGGQDESLKML